MMSRDLDIVAQGTSAKSYFVQILGCVFVITEPQKEVP
jgi:hypothetical protein